MSYMVNGIHVSQRHCWADCHQTLQNCNIEIGSPRLKILLGLAMSACKHGRTHHSSRAARATAVAARSKRGKVRKTCAPTPGSDGTLCRSLDHIEKQGCTSLSFEQSDFPFKTIDSPNMFRCNMMGIQSSTDICRIIITPHSAKNIPAQPCYHPRESSTSLNTGRRIILTAPQMHPTNAQTYDHPPSEGTRSSANRWRKLFSSKHVPGSLA